jgi:hypothetical protein
MILWRDARRTLYARLVAEQRHDMPRAGTFDDFVQTCQRADVDHSFFCSFVSSS